jgi:hypothetical protein
MLDERDDDDERDHGDRSSSSSPRQPCPIHMSAREFDDGGPDCDPERQPDRGDPTHEIHQRRPDDSGHAVHGRPDLDRDQHEQHRDVRRSRLHGQHQGDHERCERQSDHDRNQAVRVGSELRTVENGSDDQGDLLRRLLQPD